MRPMRRILLGILLALPASSLMAETLRVEAPTLNEGASWTVLSWAERSQPVAFDGNATFWDLRPFAADGRLIRWTLLDPSQVELDSMAQELGADRALCASEMDTNRRLGCRLFAASEATASGPAVSWTNLETEGRRIGTSLSPVDTLEVGDRYVESWQTGAGLRTLNGRAVAEGVALLPAGPHEVVVLEERISTQRLRFRFLTRTGEIVAVLEGASPPPGGAFQPDSGELRAAPAADDGVEINYERLSDALVPGRTGFLQYSQENLTPLASVDLNWTSVPEMIAIDSSNVSYQPDPLDPGSETTLPEVWDFSTLETGNLTYRTFNTTRDDLAGNSCGEVCALRNVGPNPPDGSWQAYLKIDNYDPVGAFLTRDIFNLNDNDTGANPSIDVPYVGQNELDVNGGRTQICFEQSAGGSDRLLRFFQFTGPDPASAVLGVGDTWGSGNWNECDNANGLRLTATILCPNSCYPDCTVSPRARGLLGGGVGLRATIVEDGWVHVAPGNYMPALLMRQDTDVLAGIDFFGVCNLSPTRLRAFDYFWLQEDFGLLALVSSPSNESILADDWSLGGNLTDGADFTWGPYPPYQSTARACLSGTKIEWALPQDGSNLGAEPGISDYGYVVAWGSLTDPRELSDWDTNPNHTPLPGDGGYLVAPAGNEPTSHVVTTWPGATINATVVTALRYTDPDVADTASYRSPAFYKVAADPAKLDPVGFAVGGTVAPFVQKSGVDLILSWPSVAGAGSYSLTVYDLDTKLEIACPAGLDCRPTAATSTHVAAGSSASNYGYRVVAVDPCGEESTN